MKKSFTLLLFFTGSTLFLSGALLAFSLPGLSPDGILSAHFASEPYPFLTVLITLLTHLNSPLAVALYLLIIVGVLLYRKRKESIFFTVTAIAGTAIVNSLLKALIDRPRPELRLVEIHSPSFPSWHSSTSAALALTLWLLFVHPLPDRATKRLWSLILFLWPLLIGFSRLFLNAHWASDILAGWGLGILITALAAQLLLPVRENPHGDA